MVSTSLYVLMLHITALKKLRALSLQVPPSPRFQLLQFVQLTSCTSTRLRKLALDFSIVLESLLQWPGASLLVPVVTPTSTMDHVVIQGPQFFQVGGRGSASPQLEACLPLPRASGSDACLAKLVRPTPLGHMLKPSQQQD